MAIGTAAALIGSAVIGGASAASAAKKSANAQQQAAQTMADAAKFDPWNVNMSGVGSANFNGGTVSGSLSPEYQALRTALWQKLGSSAAGMYGIQAPQKSTPLNADGSAATQPTMGIGDPGGYNGSEYWNGANPALASMGMGFPGYTIDPISGMTIPTGYDPGMYGQQPQVQAGTEGSAAFEQGLANPSANPYSTQGLQDALTYINNNQPPMPGLPNFSQANYTGSGRDYSQGGVQGSGLGLLAQMYQGVNNPGYNSPAGNANSGAGGWASNFLGQANNVKKSDYDLYGNFSDRLGLLRQLDKSNENKFFSSNLDGQFAKGILASTAGQYQTEGALDSLAKADAQRKLTAYGMSSDDWQRAANQENTLRGQLLSAGTSLQGMASNESVANAQLSQANNQFGATMGYNYANLAGQLGLGYAGLGQNALSADRSYDTANRGLGLQNEALLANLYANNRNMGLQENTANYNAATGQWNAQQALTQQRFANAMGLFGANIQGAQAQDSAFNNLLASITGLDKIPTSLAAMGGDFGRAQSAGNAAAYSGFGPAASAQGNYYNTVAGGVNSVLNQWNPFQSWQMNQIQPYTTGATASDAYYNQMMGLGIPGLTSTKMGP